jgi:hypothetical protein
MGKIKETRDIIICGFCHGMGYTVNKDGRKNCIPCDGEGRHVVISMSVTVKFKKEDALRSDIHLGIKKLTLKELEKE